VSKDEAPRQSVGDVGQGARLQQGNYQAYVEHLHVRDGSLADDLVGTAPGTVWLAHSQEILSRLPVDVVPDLAPLPPGSRMDLSANPLFGGREDELRQLAIQLKHASFAAVIAATGTGGIGKTQLTIEFAHRYGQYFAGGTYWLNFSDTDGVPAEVAACPTADLLRTRPDFEALELEAQVHLVRAEWQKPVPRLLIFDNCEDEELLDRWRPATGGCRLLLTSRRAEWDEILGVQTVSLNVLRREDSVRLLRRYIADVETDARDLDEIAVRLGDLPLALHLAGSFLGRYRYAISPAEYLNQLGNSSLLSHPSLSGRGAGRSPTKHELSVARTFAMSYEKLVSADHIDAQATRLLARAAHLFPGESIPHDFLVASLTGDPHDAHLSLSAEDSLSRLLTLGLLERQADGGLRMHGLVAGFVNSLNPDRDAQLAIENALLRRLEGVTAPGNPAHIAPLHRHLKYATDVALPRRDETAGRLCDELGYYFRTSGDYESAIFYISRSVAILSEVLGSEHPDLAAPLNNLGGVFKTQGKYDEAQQYLQRALDIRVMQLGKEHPKTATSFNNLGRLLHAKGDLLGAERLLTTGLNIREAVLSDNHPDVAISLGCLGALYRDQGNLERARVYFELALAIRERALGDRHARTAVSLHELGELLVRLSREDVGKTYLAKALQIREDVLGADHPKTQQVRTALLALQGVSGRSGS